MMTVLPQRSQNLGMIQIGTLRKGIFFIATRDNDQFMYPIPSHKNYFGELKVSNLIIDSGCSSHLIRSDSMEMLHRVFDQLVKEKYNFGV
jgi:hypothetical protein